jgi:uncharacterized phage protein (TIGR01671 family)
VRDIEYRGIRKDTGETVYGSILIWHDGSCHIFAEDEEEIIPSCTKYEIFPESVGEYTGLKDKNGKQLFENDIISYEGITGLIQFSHGIFGIKWFEDSSVMRGMYGQLHDLRRMDDGFNEKIEVIGDMIQNGALK